MASPFLLPIALLLSLAQASAPAPAAPGDRAAAEAAITKLAQARQYDAALAAYDRQVNASSHKPDPALLAIIGRAQLNEIAAGAGALLAAGARERLAAAGDDAARTALRQAAGGPAGSDAASASTEALLRLGDAATIGRVTSLLQSAPPDTRGALIQTLARANVTSAGSAIVPYLTDSSPQIRAVAAQAVGDLRVRAAVPALQTMFDKDAQLKVFAGVALKQLGQASVNAYIADLLTSGVPDVRLRAAGAYPASESRTWLPLVRELRNNPNEVVRVHAAERMACCDVPTSRAILLETLKSTNTLLRMEAATVLDQTGLADAVDARRLMGETTDMLRMRGAGIALRLARR
jgi:HEAT repeat protein